MGLDPIYEHKKSPAGKRLWRQSRWERLAITASQHCRQSRLWCGRRRIRQDPFDALAPPIINPLFITNLSLSHLQNWKINVRYCSVNFFASTSCNFCCMSYSILEQFLTCFILAGFRIYKHFEIQYCQLRRARRGPENFLTNGFGILQRTQGIFSSSPLTRLSSSYSKLQKVQFVLEIEPLVKSISSVALFNYSCKNRMVFLSYRK